MRHSPFILLFSTPSNSERILYMILVLFLFGDYSANKMYHKQQITEVISWPQSKLQQERGDKSRALAAMTTDSTKFTASSILQIYPHRSQHRERYPNNSRAEFFLHLIRMLNNIHNPKAVCIDTYRKYSNWKQKTVRTFH
jgi:hypothetical protein